MIGDTVPAQVKRTSTLTDLSILRVALLFILAMVALFAVGIQVIARLILGKVAQGGWTYAAGGAMLNWFNTGFARRELQGTIQAFIPGSPLFSTAVFWLATYAALTLLFLGIVGRREPTIRTFALGSVFGAVLERVGQDVGRTDPAVMVCGVIAIWAARAGRWPIAATAIVIALLFHETGIIILGPLVAVASVQTGSWRSWRSRAAAIGAVILGTGLCFYVVAALNHFHVALLAQRVHAAFSDPDQADLAIYFNTTGLRGLRTAMCLAAIDPNYWVQVVSGASILAVLAFILLPGRWIWPLVSVLAPYLALSIIAVDVGRWTIFGVFGIGMLATAARDGGGGHDWWPTALALLTFPLLAAGGSYREVAVSVPVTDFLAQRLGVPSPMKLPIETCDPRWKQVIGLVR